ncbi:hypothetical protein [Pseudanabaena sp. PCC 6802]|uniref:hypothetical protein n=1 Tax=Pseudanabaena sp. PCC 6802 TaxID=118173 RepID=UPI00035FEF01|nr:hypothetical protein [Pseudanabaena sp. PCC 6802]
MRVKTASITYARKFNLGNYESLEMSVSLWSEVDVDEDESAVCEYLFSLAKEQLKANLPPKMQAPTIQKTFTKFGQVVDEASVEV